MKALKLLKKYGYLINQYSMDLVSKDITEAIEELEELIKKDKKKNCEECYDKTITALDSLEKRSCQNCDTHPSNCRIFYGASKQLALSTETFNCSLWGPKK